MKNRSYRVVVLAFSLFAMFSCSDSFLDKEPNERSVLNSGSIEDSEEKIRQLLISAYPSANYGWICEISSDNMMDNNADHFPISGTAEQIKARFNLSSFDRCDDELFRFDQGVSSTGQDTPSYVWNDFYNAIFSCNSALETIDEVVAGNDGKMTATLKALQAEALLIRAYSHFVLLNIFSQAYKGEEASKNDIGIPFISNSKTDFTANYSRGTVTDCYAKIIEDLEKALPNVSDAHLKKAAKYHFNVNAAHAFAARVYLYHHDWEKAETEATKVLGEDNNLLAAKLIDFTGMDECTSANDYGIIYQDPESQNNLMLLNTGSWMSRHALGYRYAQNSLCCREIYYHETPFTGLYCYPFIYVGGWTFWTGKDYGYYAAKIAEEFEYSDKLAGIGYGHIIRREFTNNMLLLERAEARIMRGNYTGAFDDMAAWLKSYQTFSEANMKTFRDGHGMRDITVADINSYFTPKKDSRMRTVLNYNCFENWNLTDGVINANAMGYNIPSAAVPYMNCLNEFRRIETCWDGWRFWDLKRWGIEWSHTYWDLMQRQEITTHMAWDDPRRALELPESAIQAGLEPSRPVAKKTSTESYTTAPMEVGQKNK